MRLRSGVRGSTWGLVLALIGACHGVDEYGAGTPCSPSDPCRGPLVCQSGHCTLISDAGSGGATPLSSETGGLWCWSGSTHAKETSIGGATLGSGDASVAGGTTSSVTPTRAGTIGVGGAPRGSGGLANGTGIGGTTNIANGDGGTTNATGGLANGTGGTGTGGVVLGTGGFTQTSGGAASGNGGTMGNGGTGGSAGGTTLATGGISDGVGGKTNATSGVANVTGGTTAGTANSTGGAGSGGADGTGGTRSTGGSAGCTPVNTIRKLGFHWLGRSCQATAPHEVVFTLNESEVARVPLANSCDCAPGVGSVDVLDPALLALGANGVNVFRATTTGELSWATVSIETPLFGTELVIWGAWEYRTWNDALTHPENLCESGVQRGLTLSGVATELGGGVSCDWAKSEPQDRSKGAVQDAYGYDFPGR